MPNRTLVDQLIKLVLAPAEEASSKAPARRPLNYFAASGVSSIDPTGMRGAGVARLAHEVGDGIGYNADSYLSAANLKAVHEHYHHPEKKQQYERGNYSPADHSYVQLYRSTHTV